MKKYRLISQIIFLGLSNLGYCKVTGLIFPFFYCHQCPLATATCPIGALEHGIIKKCPELLLYLLGFVALIGIIFGRLFCGWACPIGFLQDIVSTHKKRKKKVSAPLLKIDMKLRYAKYIILVLTIILSYLTGLLAFTLICPVGGLTATLPTLTIQWNKYILGNFFWYKMTFLFGAFILIVLIRRGFCKYLCPFGALIAVFNKVSIVRLKFNKEKCNNCEACLTACPMNVDPRNLRETECIRCFRCS
ncbi:MAG: 4Fe-4S binding protein, partial [Candidatus Thermoplasmatota archaeon]